MARIRRAFLWSARLRAWVGVEWAGGGGLCSGGCPDPISCFRATQSNQCYFGRERRKLAAKAALTAQFRRSAPLPGRASQRAENAWVACYPPALPSWGVRGLLTSVGKRLRFREARKRARTVRWWWPKIALPPPREEATHMAEEAPWRRKGVRRPPQGVAWSPWSWLQKHEYVI